MRNIERPMRQGMTTEEVCMEGMGGLALSCSKAGWTAER